MKKIIAITMLLIHLYNVGGQLLCYQLLVYKSDKLFSEEINKDRYNTADLTEVKIQVNMPGVKNWAHYEYLSGQVKFKNASYNYVKLKVTRTAIYLMCIPNYPTTHLVSQNVIDARQINDIPIPKKEHVPFGKTDLSSYNYQTNNYNFLVPVKTLGENIYHNYAKPTGTAIKGPGEPPDKQL